MYQALEKECFGRSVSLSQVITERIQQGFAYEKLMEKQEEMKAQTLLEEVKNDVE
jgi:hypothetical protein